MRLKQLAIAMSATVGLSACGGGSSSGGTEVGSFSLGVSDSPATVEAVVIGFKQVVLKNEEGSISFNVTDDGSIEQVNLLDYPGTALAPLVSGEEVDALSFLTHKDQAESRGRKILKQLRKEIPRHQFEVALRPAARPRNGGVVSPCAAA